LEVSDRRLDIAGRPDKAGKRLETVYSPGNERRQEENQNRSKVFKIYNQERVGGKDGLNECRKGFS